MENISKTCMEHEMMDLPPGFRFHPTDEELITHYLSPKVLDSNFYARAIGEADLNKCEPWDLPWKAKMGEKEWYFFCVRDRKYPTGLRTNRATDAGYWKATGKDKEIYRAKTLVGMKKTLVFYKGRAPRGEKTNWVMHEFRLDGKFTSHNIPKSAKIEWVICRIFQKSSGGKKTPISCMLQFAPSVLPPLMDSSPVAGSNASHVDCLSDPLAPAPEEEDIKSTQNMSYNTFTFTTAAATATTIPSSSSLASIQNSFYAPNLEYQDSMLMQEQSILRMLFDNNNNNDNNNVGIGQSMDMNMMTMMMGSSNEEFSPDTGGISTDMSSAISNHDMFQEEPSISAAAPLDLDCLWNY